MSDGLYDFELPDELIAQVPARPRDHARLLVYRLADGSITDTVFYELEQYLPADTTLVINDSKVEHCRLLFNGGATEIFIVEKNDPVTVRAMVRPGRKFKLGAMVDLTDWLRAEVLAIDGEGMRTLRLNVQHDDSRLKNHEHVPLPPYIRQDDNLADEYQTVYADPAGSLAAPTAGLHFTDQLLAAIRHNHEVAQVTLHVGLGTFAKLTDDNLQTGRLHRERYEVDEAARTILERSTHRTAVGTTSVRTLETFYKDKSQTRGDTDIFIRPGYSFTAVDSMITNFHLPGTSLLMLVAALIADKRNLPEPEAAAELQRIYRHAVNQRYRFYSFGDAMLLV